MNNPDHFQMLTTMMLNSPFVRQFDCDATVREGWAEFTVLVDEDHYHGAGSVHGSLYFFALDNAAMLAANSIITDSVVFTTDFTVGFLRPMQNGVIRAVGNLIKSGQSKIHVEAKAYDSTNRELAHGNGTFLPAGLPLNEDIGYR